MKLGIVAALLLAAPANAEIVEIPFSGSLNSAYGDFYAGQAFNGTITYNREEYDQSEIYWGLAYFSFKVGSFEYFTNITYTFLDTSTGEFSTMGSRSDQNLIQFFGLTSTPGFLPTAAQFAGAKGHLKFDASQGVLPNGDPIYSGGEGVALVAPVPEPATWVAMFLGLVLAAGVARYRRREPRITFTHA
jgi:hypothetical protein